MELTQNPGYEETPGLLKSRSLLDWVFAALLAAGALFSLNRYGEFMDIYEKGIRWQPCPPLSGWAGTGGQCVC